MRKALVVLLVATFAASAMASLDIFVTSANPANAGYIGGLSNPAQNFDPTGDLKTDLMTRTSPQYRLDQNVAIQTGHVAPIINPAIDGDSLYIWAQFTAHTPDMKIQGMNIAWAPGANVAELAYYVVDNTNGTTLANNATKFKRWDGAYTGAIDPEFKLNPQILAAVQTLGLNNSEAAKRWAASTWKSTNVGPGENLQGEYVYDDAGTPDDPEDDTASTIYLLGAIKVLPGMYDLMPVMGELGITTTGGEMVAPVNFVGAHIIPEPASMLLLGLGLLLRRR